MTLDIAVVVPARNAADLLAECLAAIRAEHPRELIVVDGRSTDATREIAEGYGARVVSDDGRGLPYARMLGAGIASSETVALIDADVVVPSGQLRELFAEFIEGDYDGLQAGLRGTSPGGGYWSCALAFHQNIGVVRRLFGVSATLMRRDVLLEVGFDDQFVSGEDIDLRYRLEQGGYRIGVSETAHVAHRFPDGWAFAKGQWLADGAGLARMVRTHGLDHAWLVAVPLAAALRGLLLGRTLRWLPYFACFVLFNYAAMLTVLLDRTANTRRGRGQHAVRERPTRGTGEANTRGLAGNGFFLAAARVLPMGIGFAFWLAAARLYSLGDVGLAAATTSSALLCAQVALLGQGNATISAVGREPGVLRHILRRAVPVVLAGAALAAAGALGLFLTLGGQLAARLLSPSIVPLFVGLCVAATLALYLDHVAVATRRADRALRRSTVQAVIGFAVLVSFRTDAVTTVLIAWNAGMWISVVLGAHDVRTTPVQRTPGSGTSWGLAGLLREGLWHHALTVADRAPGLLLPVIVTELASPAAGAHWYVVWMIAMAAWYVPNSAAHALQTELARDPARVADGVRTTLLAGFVVPLLGIAVAWPVLRVFGTDYVTALPALILLFAAVGPQAVTQLALADDRVHRRFGVATIAVGTGGLVAIAVGSLVVGTAGITALAAVWLLVQVAIAGYGQRRVRPLVSLTTAAARSAPTPPAARRQPLPGRVRPSRVGEPTKAE